MMRDLPDLELDQVTGGIGLLGAGAGVAFEVFSQLGGDGLQLSDWDEIAISGASGAVGGLVGRGAVAASTAARGARPANAGIRAGIEAISGAGAAGYTSGRLGG